LVRLRANFTDIAHSTRDRHTFGITVIQRRVGFSAAHRRFTILSSSKIFSQPIQQCRSAGRSDRMRSMKKKSIAADGEEKPPYDEEELLSYLGPGFLVFFEGIDLHPPFKNRYGLDAMTLVDQFLQHVGERSFGKACRLVERG
jgi:hypothetical protein